MNTDRVEIMEKDMKHGQGKPEIDEPARVVW